MYVNAMRSWYNEGIKYLHKYMYCTFIIYIFNSQKRACKQQIYKIVIYFATTDSINKTNECK